MIANEGNFVKINKVYDLYNNFEKDHIDISTVRYIITIDQSLKDIEEVVNKRFYERLIDKKSPRREKYLELHKSMLRTIYKIDDEVEIKGLLNNLMPFLETISIHGG